MSKKYYINNFRTAIGIVDIELKELGSDMIQAIDPAPMTIMAYGKFTTGNDNPDDEMILFPGNWDVKLKFDDVNEMLDFTDRLTGAGIECTVYKDVDSVKKVKFVGNSKIESIDKDPYLKTIDITFYDEISFLRNPNPITFDPLHHVAYGITELFEMGFNNNSFDFNFLTDIKYQYLHEGDAITQDGYLEDIGMFDTQAADTTSFQTYGDLLKAIMINLASKVVIDFNREVTVSPRFQRDLPIIFIKKGDCYQDKNEISFVPAVKGLRLKYQVDQTKVKTWGTVELKDDGSLAHPSDVKDYLIIMPIDNAIDNLYGEPGWSGSAFKVELPTYGKIQQASCQYKKSNGTYSSASSLIIHAGNLLWADISVAKTKRSFSLPGVDFNFDCYFKFWDDSKIFRPIKFVYDEMNNSTEIVAVSCPAPEFTPQDIAGLILNLDAAASATVTKDINNKVSKWVDKSDYASEWIQTETDTQPRHEANIQNGLPGVNFEFNDTWANVLYNKSLPVNPGIGALDDFCFNVVIKTRASARNLAGIFSGGRKYSDFGWDDHKPHIFAPTSSGGSSWGFENVGVDHTGRGIANATSIILTVRRTNGILSFYENGVLVYTNAYVGNYGWENYIWGIGCGSIREYSVGHVYVNNYEFRSYIFEILLYKGEMINNDFQKVISYLKSKWHIV